VGENAGIHILEIPVAHVKRFSTDEFFGHAGPEHERTGNFVALHQLLHRQHRHDVQGLPGIVPFAVTGRTLHNRVFVGHAGFLTGFGNAVDVGANGNERLARPPGRDPGRWNPSYAFLHGEPFFFEQIGQVRKRLFLLKTEFRETEQPVIYLLRLIFAGIDGSNSFRFEPLDFVVDVGFLSLRQQQRRPQNGEEQQLFHKAGFI